MQYAMVMIVHVVGFIHAICYDNDRTYTLTCLANTPAFKRFLVLKNSFFKFGIKFKFDIKIFKFEIEIFIWKQDF